MIPDLFKHKRKHVEYIEHAYDLIFVYLVGKNISILHHTHSGFFSLHSFLLYLCFTLVVLQVWYFSSLYINRYGENSVREHVFLFSNMYLLYFLADGIGFDSSGHFTQFCVSWGLLLLNIALQYFIQLHKLDGSNEFEETPLKAHMISLIIQAVIVFVSIPVSNITGNNIAWFALVFGIVASFLGEQLDFMIPMDVFHMTERIMLYMLYTFGETILSICDFFEGSFTITSIYYSLSAFLIVAGMFLIYGIMYNHVIDRHLHHIGMFYMIIHVGLILMLNNITVGLEFMRNSHVIMSYKSAFLTGSFILLFFILYFLKFYSKKEFRQKFNFFPRMSVISCIYAFFMYWFYQNAFSVILLSLAYVYAMLIIILRRTLFVDRFFGIDPTEETE